MTDLEKSLHDVVRSLSAALRVTMGEEARATREQRTADRLYYCDLRRELTAFQGKMGDRIGSEVVMAYRRENMPLASELDKGITVYVEGKKDPSYAPIKEELPEAHLRLITSSPHDGTTYACSKCGAKYDSWELFHRKDENNQITCRCGVKLNVS